MAPLYELSCQGRTVEFPRPLAPVSSLNQKDMLSREPNEA